MSVSLSFPLSRPLHSSSLTYSIWIRYAYFKKLDYFSTECIYSPDAYRGHARVFLKDLEAARPSAIIDIIHSGEAFEVREDVKKGQNVQRTSLKLEFFSSTRGLRPIFLFFYLEKQ